ncbi:MAG: TonB-dependent receptor [Alphaproteobacteria bacterium]|nr:TonB-dependent receptor [Alphaproteobacteria bacterium]
MTGRLRSALLVTTVLSWPCAAAWAQTPPASAAPPLATSPAAAAAAPEAPPAVLPEVDVIAPTPLLGSGVIRSTVPAQTQVLTNKQITIQGPPNAVGALEQQGQGVNLLNPGGNPFQPEVLYHGFVAGPLQGTPAGLAVYVNGVRFNDPFGDTVNWDLIPDLAIDQMNLVGANPVFGLNALGGALAVQLKNGFTYHGAELDVFGGSFGQIAGQFQYGKQLGNTSVYIAGSGLSENGWRDLQSSGLKSFYGDIGWRGDRAELHLNVDLAQTMLNGPGTVPIQLLNADRSAQFTGLNFVANNYARVSLSGSYDINDTTSLQALAYYDNLLQRVGNGNGPVTESCGADSAFLCNPDTGEVATGRGGVPIPAFLGPDGEYASMANQTTNTNGYGTSLQVTNNSPVFGHANQIVAGFSYDGANSLFDANTQVGGLNVPPRLFYAPGIDIDLADGSIAPVRASINNAYYGLFFTDTFAITKALSATVAGRFNSAQIKLNDLNGGALTGNHVYNRFNPAAGLSYKITPGITLYGGYAQTNRAPTPAELTCSNAAAPCSLANFFVGDPDLKQVVATTWEVGFRGRFIPFDGAKVDWNVSGYRTNSSDDIIFVQSDILGTGFFQNIGDTRRQGVDVGLHLTTDRWLAWLDYSYVNATFQGTFVESSPNNPAANADGDITVHPGDQLPGIPPQQVKLGVQYKATDKWTVGAIGVFNSSQYLFGDEANLTPPLPAWFRLDLNTSYQVTKNIQFYALVQNALDAKYYVYGTFSPTTSVPIVQVPNATNPRSYNIAAPIAAYGGVKVTF